MKNLTTANIAAACRGTYHGPADMLEQEVMSIKTDSREIEKGSLFVPIVGEKVDAHRFIPQVMEAGALVTLSEKPLGEVDFPWIQVSSSLQAVKDIAAFYLQQLNIPVVGVTGSVGKTSTKEAIACVLAEKYRVLKTEGNFNNELGLPLTVFRLREGDEIAVLEMGINHFGEMTRLAKIARPHTAVITNIGECHLEFLGDRDGVLKAKTEILDYVQKDGHIVLNGDDDKLVTVQESHGIRPAFFGMERKEGVSGGPPLALYASDVQSLGMAGSKAVFHLDGKSLPVTIPVPGRHMIYNALAAAFVGWIYGLTAGQIMHGIENIRTIAGRMNSIRTERFLLVDDCYNANPMSMKASLDVLKETPGRRTAILGDMGELGEEEAGLHKEVGAHAAACGIDRLVFVGALSQHMYQAALDAGCENAVYEPDLDSLLAHIEAYVQDADTVLVKASHFMHFEKVINTLKEPDFVPGRVHIR